MSEGVSQEELQRAREAFEDYGLNTPWGALHHAVSPSPSPPRSASAWLAALLRFWEVLQGPRYAFWFEQTDTLEALMKKLYDMMLEA